MSTSGENWFSTDFGKGISPIFKNSDVTAFVDAEEYYADLRAEVESTLEGDLICWIGFDVSGDTPMPVSPNNEPYKAFPPRSPGKDDVKWFDLLQDASDKRGVQLRVLLNLHPSPKPPDRYKGMNFNLVSKLNTLKNCAAINDFRYLYMNGTHHQKLVLVYNARKGLMAYVGTCDIETGRIMQRWGEVQLKITGDASAELFSVFQRRWSEHTQVFLRFGSQNSNLKPVSQLKTTATRSGNYLVQTSTTYGNPNRYDPFDNYFLSNLPVSQVVNQPHRIDMHSDVILVSTMQLISNAPIYLGNDFFTEVEPGSSQLIQEAARQDRTYNFAPDGHTGIYLCIAKAISQAKQFIYMEDQYLVCDMPMGKLTSMNDLLIAKLKEPTFKKLILFCTRIDDINDEFQRTGWKHRKNMIYSLVAAGGRKVEICQYKSKGSVNCSGEAWSSIFYTHSKTWIFDDELLITGSANCNRRGYSHDSELDITVYDQNKFFVKELRVKIWKRRLNVEGMLRSPITDTELADFLSAAKFWENPDQYGLPLQNSKITPFDPKKYPDLDLASYKALVTGAPGFNPQANAFIDKMKMDGFWDYVVDPDGT